MNMKKFLALLMIALFALPLVACNDGSTPTATLTPTPGTTAPTQTGEETTTPESTELEIPVKPGTYSITHVATGTQIQSDKKGKLVYTGDGMYSQVSVDYIVTKGEVYYRLGLFGVEQVKNKTTDKVIDNHEVLSCIAADKIKDGSPVKTNPDSLSDKKQTWRIIPNDDGTFCIANNLRPTGSRLAMVDGQLTIVGYAEGDDISNFKFKFENKSTDNPLYYEYVSEKGNAVVRVPRDVFDEKYYPAAFDKDIGKLKRWIPTEDTLQKYAENIQFTYDTYIELTNFKPYDVIILHGYNYQGVMAGVVGSNNNIFVNCGSAEVSADGTGEWFYSDLSKMQYRMEKLGKNDVNFMQLHEMGHMFDYDRGWTFESEMQADLKAAYLLCTTKDNYAAPAEYAEGTCFGSDIGTGGFKGLSGGKMPNGINENNKNGYSIYRNAEIFTEFCNEAGWDALKQTFHWFQSAEGTKACPSSSDSYTKLKTFVDKLSEYGKKDMWSFFDPAELTVLEKQFGKPAEEPQE